MVAVIKSGRSLRNTFFYNENKVKEGVASIIFAGNYPLDKEQLSEDFRLKMLERIAALRPTMERPGIHISLNFAPGEQPDAPLLQQITTEYMERIGFGDQPYLVYQHFDAGHPHVHILSLRIRPDGTPIDTFNIGKRLSLPALEALELKYNLVKAKDHRKEVFQLKPVPAAKVEYGKVPTKKAMGNILSSVLDRYKYTSLPELNALLRLYNISAERGEPGSRISRHKGLVYRIIGPEGRPIGTPIKASAFAYKATLKDLEARFLRNDVERQQFKSKLKLAIDWQLPKASPPTIEQLALLLKREGIDVAAHRNEEGYLFGITFIDHRNKVVFKGSDLGKAYTVNAISERLANQNAPAKTLPATSIERRQAQQSATVAKNVPVNHAPTFPEHKSEKGILEILTQAEYNSNYLPQELRKTKKKKRKKSI
ncbi:relaxase/mobilization nuclease domain-containing protein [Mucilaginibacter sp. UC70_90]